MTTFVTNAPRTSELRRLSRFLAGDGIEIGPGHAPMPAFYPGATVRYIDRWEPDENHTLFPELADAEFPKPDMVADLNVDRLSMLDDASQDFVIASHVLEHLADPLEILCEIHRVLRPGGTALILLPDRRKTKDSQRPPTSLEHLIADHTRHVEAPDDAHVEEFLRCGGGGWNDAWDADERAAQFEYHRRRSFHVHCWTEGEFLLVVLHSVKHMGLDWELLDAVFVDDFPGSIEFGMVLQRALHPLPHDEAARRLEAVWTDLFERHRERQAALLAKQRLEELRAHPIFRNAAAVRRLVKKVRA